MATFEPATATTAPSTRKKVAIVGSGCSGLAAAWALNRSTDHDVHLFEADSRLGGHTNTCDFTTRDGKTVRVDTGFIVMNTATYPNFINFLRAVGVPTRDTDMTFGVSRDSGKFEWAGTSLASIFAQKRNLLKPSMWRMIFDIVRFNQFALDLLADADESENDPISATAGSGGSKKQHAVRPLKPITPAARRGQESIGEYLDREGYSDAFRNDYLIPMTACVWSTTPDKCSLSFPALTLVRFLWNHHLLSTIAARPTWMTIPGGSQSYIDAIVRDFPAENIHVSSPVNSLFARADGKLILQLKGLRTDVFDHVILATHGDQAMRLMAHAATPAERAVLGSFETSQNVAVMHSDAETLMPKRRVAWSAWNYLTTSGPQGPHQVCLTYWMNLLQHIPEKDYGHVLVTLNPLREPDEKTVQGSYVYEHPLYNQKAVQAQKQLPSIQNSRGISYAGAWTKFGFHEDGFSSGLQAAVEHLGAELPFDFVDSTFSRGRRPVLTWKDHAIRIVLRLIQIAISVGGILLMLLGVTGPKKRKLP